jgi:hypothetical protein
MRAWQMEIWIIRAFQVIRIFIGLGKVYSIMNVGDFNNVEQSLLGRSIATATPFCCGATTGDRAFEVYFDDQTVLTFRLEDFKQLFPNQSIIDRLIIGNYDQPKDVLKRSMAKFVRDIARGYQLIP